MNTFEKNDEFYKINRDILSNSSFFKLKELSHHGINRYDHSVSVAYISYKIAKKLKLDYVQVAKGALLHDFFDTNYQDGIKGRLRSIIRHPDLAVSNAQILFGLAEKERDIIKTHMFPFGLYQPNYKESWLVMLVDKTLSVYEVCYASLYKMNYASSILKIFLINLLR